MVLSSSVVPRAARDAAYLIAGLPAGIVTFTVLLTGLAFAAGFAITLVGIPLLLATLFAARALGDAERFRAGWVLPGGAIRRTRRPWAGGLWARTKAACADPGAWRDTAWGLLVLPILGTAGFCVAVTLWSAALGFVTQPLWYWAVPREHHDTAALRLLDSHAAGPQVLRVVVGLLLVPVAYLACRALAAGTARAARAVLAH